MSTAYYQQKWEEAIGDLLGCIQEQNVPLEQNKNDKGITYKRTDLQWFQYYGELYVRYLQVYQKLQNSYDQMVHPQKRIIMKQMLQNVIVRMCQVKQNLIRYSTQTNIIQSDFINIDEILSEMKLTPKALRVPLPKYYRQTFIEIENAANSIERCQKSQQIQQIFKFQALDQNKQNFDKTKNISQSKFRKFKTKDKNQQRDQILDQIIKDMGIPEEIQVFNDQYTLEANMQFIVRLIQKIQRGRQGIVRGQQAIKLRNRAPKQISNNDQSQNYHLYVTIQKYWRAFVARRQLNKLRSQQLRFLGIQKAPTDKSLLQKAQQTRVKLKESQQVRCLAFQYKKQKVKYQIEKNEKTLMKAQMQDNRRKWINKFLQIHQFNNLPSSLKEYYEQKQNQQKMRAQQQKQKQQSKKGNAKQPKKQAKDQTKNKGTKKNEVEKFIDQHISIGPTEAVTNLQKTVQSYSTAWASKECSQISQQIFDNELARNQIRPQVQSQLQKQVDALISLELDCMRIKYGIKKKKQKKPKKKKKKEKKVKIPQGLGKRSPEDLLRELFNTNVAKILNPASMQDFIGDHNNLNYLIEKTAQIQPDPSMFQVRNLVAEYVGIPLGSQYAKDKLQKWGWFLFYGPMGTGKTLLTRALQKQTKSIVFDLTPNNVKQQYKQKSQLTKLAWSVIICAKHFQPSIVLIEDFETIFPGTGVKTKKKSSDPFSNFGPKMKKPIVDIKKNKLWAKNDRIAVIGCSNKPYDASLKQMKKIFDKKIYFPYPNYPTRKLMFQTFLERNLGHSVPNFPYNTLAYTTQGFTPGSYLKCIQKVLTEDRKSRIKDSPLKVKQFILTLSNTVCVFSDQYQKFKKFTDDVTGLKQRRQAKNSKKQDDKKDPKKNPKKK